MMHTYTPNQCLYQVSTPTPYSFQDIAQIRFLNSRSKVKVSQNVLHLQPLSNVPSKYQLPTLYGFRDIARTRFYKSRSLLQG